MLMKCTFLMLGLQVNWCWGAFQSIALKESSLNTELLTDSEDIGPNFKIVKKRSPTESLNSTVEPVQEESTINGISPESAGTEQSSSETTITKSSSEETSISPTSETHGSQSTSESSIITPTTATVSAKPSSEVATTAVPLQNDQDGKTEADEMPEVIREITANGTGVDDSTQKETSSDAPKSSSNGTSNNTNVGDKAIEAIQEIGKDIIESVGNLSNFGFQWFTDLLHKGSELLTSTGQPEAGTIVNVSVTTETT